MEHQNIRTLINVRRTMLTNRARTNALIQSIFRLYGGNVKLLNGMRALAAEVNDQVQKMRQHGLDTASAAGCGFDAPPRRSSWQA